MKTLSGGAVGILVEVTVEVEGFSIEVDETIGNRVPAGLSV